MYVKKRCVGCVGLVVMFERLSVCGEENVRRVEGGMGAVGFG